MRTILLMYALVACGKDGGGAGSASGSGAAEAVTHDAVAHDSVVHDSVATPVDAALAGCLPSDSDTGVTAFTADDKLATVCTKNGDAPIHCIAIDLASGAAQLAAPPPSTPPQQALPAGYAVHDETSGVELCKDAACTKLPLDPRGAADPPNPGRVILSKSRLVALAELPGHAGIGLFDTTTGRKIKKLVTYDGGHCPDDQRFLDDTAYVTTSNCGGPDARAQLFSPHGKRIASFDDVNVEGGEPLRISGDTWAVPGMGGDGTLVFDAKTGRVRATDDPARFEQCEGCYPVGIGPHFGVSPLVISPGGKLVELTESGGIWVIDASTGKTEKAWPIPSCPPPADTGSATP